MKKMEILEMQKIAGSKEEASGCTALQIVVACGVAQFTGNWVGYNYYINSGCSLAK